MFYRITPICLDALSWRTSDATCRDHLAVKPVGQKLPCQRIAARARLVDYLQGARGAVMTQSFADLLKVRTDGTDEVRYLPVLSGGCYSDGVLMDIQADVHGDNLMHGLP